MKQEFQIGDKVYILIHNNNIHSELDSSNVELDFPNYKI